MNLEEDFFLQKLKRLFIKKQIAFLICCYFQKSKKNSGIFFKYLKLFNIKSYLGQNIDLCFNLRLSNVN